MDYLSPAAIRIVPQRQTLLAVAALVVAALICLANADQAAALVGLTGSVLAITWVAAATAITHVCGGHRLVLKPPTTHADFHQLSGFRVEVRLGNQRKRAPALFITARLDTRAEGIALVSPPVFLAQLGARGHAAFAWDITVRKRGEVELCGARVQLCFPGSAAAHECQFPFSYRLLALPASYRLDNRALGLLTGHRRTASRSTSTPASIGEYVGVRDYRPGDNPRNIAAALSARLPDFPNQLVVREFEDPTNDDIYVVLDTFLPEKAEDFDILRYHHEISLSFAIAFCRLLVGRRYQIRFCAIDGDGKPIELSFNRANRDLLALEARLARLRPVGEEGPVSRLLANVVARGNDAVFFISLRDASMRRRGVVAIAPSHQIKLVREVIDA